MRQRSITNILMIILFLLVSAVTNKLASQVTIGSPIPNNAGALLDLKEHEPTNNNATASRGLAMPRVKLTNRYNLFPMFETSPGSGIATSNYSSALKPIEDENHIGLLVYHTDKCTFNGSGLYAWNGSVWQKLGEETVGGLHIDKNFLDLPSGRDLRSFAAQNLTVKWSNGTTAPDFTKTASGGLAMIPFSQNPLPSALATPPATFNLLPDPMTPAEIAANPWLSKETKLTFNYPECSQSHSVTLNQTNYALIVDNSMTQNNTSDIRHLITHRDEISQQPIWIADYFWLNVKSNAEWITTYQEIIPNIIDNIIIPSTGGQDLKNGTIDGGSAGRWYSPKRSTGSRKTHYKTAGILTFYDKKQGVENRFKPIKVTFIDCACEPDLSTVENGDLLSESQWQDKVLYHADQEGNIFYSASFGNAGRWMTSNLAAKKYASNEGGGNLTVYTGDSLLTKSTSARAYGYPRYVHVQNPQQKDTIRVVSNWDMPPVRYVEHGQPWYKEQGLLYTWYAATNQNEAYVHNDQGQQIAGLENPPGMYEVENTGKYGTAPKKYIQGICPNGWHLPSDREWNELERELYNNPTKYSNYTAQQISRFSPATWNPGFETLNGWRGGNYNYKEDSGYAGVFKEICPVRDYEANLMVYSTGYSKEPAEGGFNIMSVGWGVGPHIHTYGGTARFWTSSALKNSAWGRSFSYDFNTVLRFPNIKYVLYSIRCKKND